MPNVTDLFTVFDTETSGLFNFALPADAEGQPRLASLAMIHLDADYTAQTRRVVLVKPDGWVLGAEAAAVNGLTMERLMAEGVPVRDVLEEYTGVIKSGRAIAAYNAQYDTKVLRGEFRRAGMDDLFHETRNICLMRAMTDVCQIPYANGRGGFKFPKLAEALLHIGAVNDAPHTAGGDADGALSVLQWLARHQMLPVAGVHLAKKKPGDEPPAPKRSKAPKAAPVSGDDELPA